MRRCAVIGTRKLSNSDAKLCELVGRYLAEAGCVLHTGACAGADQAYANAALRCGGRVRFHIPWASYEQEYLQNIERRYDAQVRVTILESAHQAAFDSVRDFHPAWDYLVRANKSAVIRLHARNWNIIWLPKRVDAVVALPSAAGGGTMQGVRIAAAHGIPVIRLDRLRRDDLMASLRTLCR